MGYSDHQWGNGPLSRTTKRWYWGKIDTEDHTMVFWDAEFGKSKRSKWIPKTPYRLLYVFDKNGVIFVADFYNHRVQTFASDGTFLSSFSEKGNGPGQSIYITAVAVAEDGTVFAADFANNRIQKWRPRR